MIAGFKNANTKYLLLIKPNPFLKFILLKSILNNNSLHSLLQFKSMVMLNLFIQFKSNYSLTKICTKKKNFLKIANITISFSKYSEILKFKRITLLTLSALFILTKKYKISKLPKSLNYF